MTIGVRKFEKTEWFPQPHTREISFMFELDDTTLDSTIVPILAYDEGLGTPSARETHPEHTSFAVVNEPNCFVNSRVDNIYAELRFALTSKALDENLPSVRVSFMPIHMAFKEAYTAIDELSSTEVQDVLELQTEDTDRQGGPLYVAAKDMPTAFSNSSLVGTNVPFLDTTQSLEAVAFSDSNYYNSLQFRTIEGKLKQVQSGLKWLTLTKNRPFAKIRIHMKSNVKRLNPFTFFGVLVNVPIFGKFQQPLDTNDITVATDYVRCDFGYRYNEWNPDFNFKKV